MIKAHSAHHPTVRQLLHSETMSEAQVLFGDDLLERHVTQVVSSLNPQPRAGSLVVLRSDPGSIRDNVVFKDLAALVLIRPSSVDQPAAPMIALGTGSNSLSSLPSTSTVVQAELVGLSLAHVKKRQSPLLLCRASATRSRLLRKFVRHF